MSLLELEEPPDLSEGFVADVASSTFDNDAAGLSVSPTLWQQYQSAAEELAALAVETPALYADADDADAWVAAFGLRAFRRNLTEDELAAYTNLFAQGKQAYNSGDPFADGVRATVGGMMQSPHFLYRIEGASGAELNSHEMASKLSYALWNTMPDDTLLEAAAAGLTQADVEEQVDRMLAADAARDMIQDLHRQLLHIDNYANLPRDFESYEDYSLTLPAVMQAEAYTFVDDVVFNDGTVRDLLTSRRTFVDEQLAAIYKIDDIEGLGTGEMEPVDLDPDERAGLLTLSGFLAYHATETEPNLIGRGAFVNNALLCAEIPAPPPNVPELPEADNEGTLRERIESHTSVCGGSCHSMINPVGFAFGGYNEIGKYLREKKQAEVDKTGAYLFDDGEVYFDGAVELAEMMADREEVHRCYVSHLMAYLEGRTLTDADADQLQDLTTESMNDLPILDLIADIATDPAFRSLD